MALYKKTRQIEESFIEIRIFRTIAAVLSMIMVVTLFAGLYGYTCGQQANKKELAAMAQKLADSESKYAVLVAAKPLKPLDMAIAGPAWWAGETDMNKVRDRLCNKKK